MKIVQTANDGGDYPNETFVNLPPLTNKNAKRIASVLNDCLSGEDPFMYPCFFKIVEDDYELSPPFEP
jgi:hypothetical protein